MRAPLAILAIGALAAGCGDENGVSPYTAGRTATGLWVRYLSPVEASLRPADAPPVSDTLVIDAYGSGTWSRLYARHFGGPAERVRSGIRLEAKGPVLRAWIAPPPCPACDAAGFPPPPEPWVLVLRDHDRLELRPIERDDVLRLDASVRAGAPQRFQRVTPFPAPQD